MPPKFANPYTLYKKVLEKSSVYQIFNAKDNSTQQIWLAKVIDNSTAHQLGLSEQLSFNEEALTNLQDKKNIVYLHQIFTKDQKTFFIQEKYETRLSTYLEEKGQLPSEEVEVIIRDTFEGILDIYEEDYFTRSIRPEHLVRVDGQWKIETLIHNNEAITVSPYSWHEKYASPEERKQKQKLNDHQDDVDAQLVWQMAHLALVLLKGSHFIHATFSKDSDIDRSEIQRLTKKSPLLFQLIDKCYKYKMEDRLGLIKFLHLPIFSAILRPNIEDWFITPDKIHDSPQIITRSFNGSSKIFSKSIKPIHLPVNIPVNPQFLNKIEHLLNVCRFLQRFSALLGSANISGEDEAICELVNWKLINFMARQTRSQVEIKSNLLPSNSVEGKRVEGELQDIESISQKELKKANEKITRNIQKQSRFLNSKKCTLGDIQTASERENVVRNYRQASGFLYTQIAMKYQVDRKATPNERMVAFLIYAVYLITQPPEIYEKDFQQIPQKGKSWKMNAYFSQAKIDELTSHSQALLSKYFKVL